MCSSMTRRSVFLENLRPQVGHCSACDCSLCSFDRGCFSDFSTFDICLFLSLCFGSSLVPLLVLTHALWLLASVLFPLSHALLLGLRLSEEVDLSSFTSFIVCVVVSLKKRKRLRYVNSLFKCRYRVIFPNYTLL